MQHRQKPAWLDTQNRDASPVENGGAAQDNRIGATGRIVGITVLMLLSCFAGSIGRAENAYWAIAFGAIVGTAAVWGVFNSLSGQRLPPSKTLQELNERLADVETIVSYEEKVAEAKSRRLETTTE
jgi:hypothetical protein